MQSSAEGSENWRRRRRGLPRSSWAGRPGSTDLRPVMGGAGEGAAGAAEEALLADAADLELVCTPAATDLARQDVALVEAVATAATTATATTVATPPKKGKSEIRRQPTLWYSHSLANLKIKGKITLEKKKP
jgi:hypothetical protein